MLRVFWVLLFLLPLALLAQFNNSESTFRYLRFADVPNAEQKALLEDHGIKLYQYKPNLTWLASMPNTISNEVLKKVGVTKSFSEVPRQKADPRLFAHKIPHYASSENGIHAFITVATVSNYSHFKSELSEIGVTTNSIYEPLGIFEVSGSRNALIQAAAMPFVIYVELPEPPEELEIEDEISMTRGSFINGAYNLNGVNGNGITIAVNEGGKVDSLVDPDYQNRLNRSWESGTTSGHKTGVSMRMCSAGNLDPVQRGQAWAASLWSGGINFTNAAQSNVNIVNNSFGYGCISGAVTYNAGAAINDFLVRTNSRFMITYSCGNIGGSSCAAYGAGTGWGTITGLVKSAKNIFAVGAMNTNDQLTGFSSKGPAMDGRILPDITATGPGGTSFASPNLAGVNALLTEAYRNANSNQFPVSGLIKAIILNTADDMENPGPDFRTGFGRINAKRGFDVIQMAQFLEDSVSHSSINTHSLSVPAGVSSLKVSLYWTDHEATPGITGRTLVNDLDLRVQSPNGTWTLPWILNTYPHNDSLIQPATQGVDTLNNIELVTISNPTSGTYNFEVSGSLVPSGIQSYFIVYSYVYDSIDVVFPKGGEGLVAGEDRRIRWDAFDNGNPFTIEFTADSGNSWQTVNTGIASDLRTYTWTIPSVQSGACQIRIQSGGQTATSGLFTIANPPSNLHRVWRCADSAMISWDSVPGALGYRVYRLGTHFMDTIGFTTSSHTKIYNLSSSLSEWVSVQTVLADSGSSRRAIALEIILGDYNCIGTDLAAVSIQSPDEGYYPSCLTASKLPVSFLVQNTGTMSLPQVPLAYQLNSGTVTRDTLFSALSSPSTALLEFSDSISIQNGINTLKAWTEFSGDANNSNDTLEITLTEYTSNNAPLPYSQSFDSFNGCSTSWGCSSITCNLSQGWYNVPNGTLGDSIDWRTHSGGTGSGGTGPSADHTSGNGNYLYLEGSGGSGSGCQNSVAMLHSPCFDLSQTNQPELSFWYHAFGNNIGTLHIDVLSNGKWHEDVHPPIVGSQGNQWLQYSVSLTAFQGEKVTIRFRGVTGNGWSTDMAIDDIEISTLPYADFSTTYDTFCLNQIIPLFNQSSYGTSYSWNISPNTFTYASGSSSSYSPVILASDSGMYHVELIATNSLGNDSLLKSNFFYVGDFVLPTLMADSPFNTYCFEDTASFFATGDGGIFDFYLNDTLRQSSSSSVFALPNFNSGDSIYVVNHVNSHCSYTGTKLGITKQPDYNNTPLSSNPYNTICMGDTVEISALSGFSQYEFRINGTTTSNSQNPLLQTSSLNDGDIVYCIVSDSFGCTGISNELAYIVNPIPQTPIVSFIPPDSLEASTLANHYYWSKDSLPLNDSTQTIQTQGAGLYVVYAESDGCTSKTSVPYLIEATGISELVSNGISIYPNPNNGLFYIELSNKLFNEIVLFDATGRAVFTQVVYSGINTVQIPEASSGIYLLQIKGEKQQIQSQIVIR